MGSRELGEGVFATMRAYRGRCFRAAEHLATLERGAALFGIPFPAGLAARADEAAAGADCVVRVMLDPEVHVTTRPLNLPDGPVAARVVSLRRIPAQCMDPTVKTTSYAPQVLARREAEQRGAFEGIQLAVSGELACGAMSNVFVVAGGEVLTPSLASGCRDGVTRRAVMEIASVRAAVLPASVLAEADEIFFTSARVECLPVATIDGRRLGDGRHARTREIHAALQALIAREVSP